MITSRRSLIKGLAALVAAPAIVRVASLMPVNASLMPVNAALRPGSGYLTIDQITREAVNGWIETARITKGIARYASDFGFMDGEQWDKFRVGSQLRIRLPNGFVISSASLPQHSAA